MCIVLCNALPVARVTYAFFDKNDKKGCITDGSTKSEKKL